MDAPFCSDDNVSFSSLQGATAASSVFSYCHRPLFLCVQDRATDSDTDDGGVIFADNSAVFWLSGMQAIILH